MTETWPLRPLQHGNAARFGHQGRRQLLRASLLFEHHSLVPLDRQQLTLAERMRIVLQHVPKELVLETLDVQFDGDEVRSLVRGVEKATKIDRRHQHFLVHVLDAARKVGVPLAVLERDQGLRLLHRGPETVPLRINHKFDSAIFGGHSSLSEDSNSSPRRKQCLFNVEQSCVEVWVGLKAHVASRIDVYVRKALAHTASLGRGEP